MNSRAFWFRGTIPVLIASLIWIVMLLSPISIGKVFNVNADEIESNTVYLPFIRSGGGNVFFISPSGDDDNSGSSISKAWATFDRALNIDTPGNKLQPGDTLVLVDGVYYQTLQPNEVGGQPDNPIYIRAQNDGKAIIDGQGERMPVNLERSKGASYYVIEGIIAKNSDKHVYRISADNNVLRRVSGYDAHTDRNTGVFSITGDFNLIEDCVAYGTGRIMINIFKGEHNIIRRCYADWQEWDGRERQECWPWGDGIKIYNANYNIVENSISYSRNPTKAMIIQANDPNATAIGNKILGSMAILAGMKEDGTLMEWGDTRPQPTEYTCVRNFEWPGQRGGFAVLFSGEIRDNLLQDIFAWSNAGLGLTFYSGSYHPNNGNNRVNRATIYNNGIDNPVNRNDGGIGVDALQEELLHFDSVENSYIEDIFIDWPDYPNGPRNMTTMNGEGARLTHRYVNGILTDEPLWPWPMEERIKAELGFSVTDIMTSIIFGNSIP